MQIVLVVDDDVNAQVLIELTLKSGGFQVIKVGDAVQALDILDKQHPDLIMLDVNMPGMNGIELCAVIRSRKDTAEIPILILSANGDMMSVTSAMDAGATDYLPKPIDRQGLLSKLHELLTEEH